MVQKRVTFRRWPVWNWQFAERDVARLVAVRYFDDKDSEQTLPAQRVRLAVGRNGVCCLVFKDKHELPALAERADAVCVEYEV